MSELKRTRIRPLLTTIGFVLLGSISVFAQPSRPQSQKFNEFIGEADLEHIMALLDNFSLELKKYPEAEAQIIVYRTRTASPDVGRTHADRTRDYLVRVRGMNAKKVVAIDGGMTGCLMVELWIVPPGAEPPERRYTYRYTLKESLDWKPTPKTKRKKP